MENHVANLSVERRFYKEKTKATHNKQDKPTKKKREKLTGTEWKRRRNLK